MTNQSLSAFLFFHPTCFFPPHFCARQMVAALLGDVGHAMFIEPLRLALWQLLAWGILSLLRQRDTSYVPDPGDVDVVDR